MADKLKRGFTLVEVLIVITIIGILAGLIIGVASVAGTTGRTSKTQNIINRLHTLVLPYYNEFRNRRVEIKETILQDLRDNAANKAQRDQWIQLARLYAMRELILMECPDRWSDVALATVGQPPAQPYYNEQRSALSANFARKYQAMLDAGHSAGLIMQNQSAECLYMLVTTACGDGEARTMFHENDIGDTDGDGAREFIDGWGKPISFLRWAPGFNSGVQLDFNELEPLSMADREAAISKDHDPFDVFRAEATAFRLMPLIYSSGSDEAPGIATEEAYVTWPHSAMTMRLPALTPFNIGSPGPGKPLGLDTETGEATDNLHNHSTSRRLAVKR